MTRFDPADSRAVCVCEASSAAFAVVGLAPCVRLLGLSSVVLVGGASLPVESGAPSGSVIV